MPILTIKHRTRYSYRQPVSFGEHRMMFRPRESYDQRVLESRLIISPEPCELRYVQDVFGNCVGIARFDTPASELVFESEVRLEHNPSPLIAAEEEIDESAAIYPFRYSADDLPDLHQSVRPHYDDPDAAVQAWAERFVRRRGPTKVVNLLTEMTYTIREEFAYATRLYGPAQSPTQTLALETGSCRDFALLMMEAVRRLGLAAHFVSGYIYSPAAGPGRRLGGGHTHAWVRVYLPSCGWVEFDPTNGIVGNTDLVRVAVARDPRQAVPLWGSWSGPAAYYQGMDVEVDVDVEPVAPQRVALSIAG